MLGGVSAEEFEEVGVDVEAERLLEVEMEVGQLMLQSAVQEKQEQRRAKQLVMVGGGTGGGGNADKGNKGKQGAKLSASDAPPLASAMRHPPRMCLLAWRLLWTKCWLGDWPYGRPRAPSVR